MEFWFLVIGIVVIYQGYPHVRIFFKRLGLRSKVKKKCREKGYSVQGTHRFWFLGGKNGKKCDCFIETEEELFAIKLFCLARHRRVLIFTDDNKFFIRRFFQHVSMRGGYATGLMEIIESDEKPIPEYIFDCNDKQVAEGKPLRKLLLVNPVPMAIHMKPRRQEEYVIFPGEMISGMELMNLSGLLTML